MTESQKCPERAQLRKLAAAGRYADSQDEQLWSHIDQCADCRALYAELRTENFVAAVIENGLVDSSGLRTQVAAPLPLEHLKQPLPQFRDPPSDGTHLGYIDDYQVVAHIGSGKFGWVFKVCDGLARTLAIKVLRPQFAMEATSVERFRREALALAAVKHPNVIEIITTGFDSQLNLHYLVIEYVPFGSASDAVRANQFQSPWTAAMIARDAARGLHAVHLKGFIHRDVKPSNILLGSPNTAKVSDFGLAYSVNADLTLTHSGSFLGSPAYASPEAHTDDKLVDARSDVYSLGVTLYELATGQLPFQAQALSAIAIQVSSDDPRLPSHLNPEVDRELETIILKAMAREPSERYPTAEAFADDLDRYLRSEPIRAQRASTWKRWRDWCRREPLFASLILAILSCLLLMTVGSAIFAWRLSSLWNQRAVATLAVFENTVPEAANQIFEQIIADRAVTSGLIHMRLSDRSLSAVARLRLQAIAMEKTPDLFPNVFQSYCDTESIDESRLLLQALLRMPSSLTAHAIRVIETPAEEKELEIAATQQGRQRAKSAIALLRLQSDHAGVSSVFQEIESGAQLVHWTRKMGVPAHELDWRFTSEQPPEVRFGILQVLGEYPVDQIPTSLIDKAMQAVDDDDPGVARTANWLRRRWQLAEPKQNKDFEGNKWCYLDIAGSSTAFIKVLPAEFWMGSKNTEADRNEVEGVETRHRVRITHPFLIAEREVTVEQFEVFMRAKHGAAYKPIQTLPSDAPYTPSWIEAIEFCRWLTKTTGLPEDQQCYDDPEKYLRNGPDEFPIDFPIRWEKAGFRLPTEAEWELACRCGTACTYSFGSDKQMAPYYSWTLANKRSKMSSTRLLRPNRWGLFDCHGNANEWCSDPQAKYPLDDLTVDPLGITGFKGHYRALRGGSYDDEVLMARSAERLHARIDSRGDYPAGLRLVQTVVSP